MNVKALIICLFLAGPAWAQGFAGLGTEADGFAVPARGLAFDFPADHGPHPTYRIEWWYLTATLTGADGRDYGVQWTLFRSALAPEERAGWSSPQIWLGHAGLTTPEQHFVAERLARGGVGQAGVTASPFHAWIDDWAMQGPDLARRVQVSATGADFAYDLSLTADHPIVPHGDEGYSVKSAAGQASYYYSQPFYEVTGTLSLPDGPMVVTGQAWLDREWSSQPLADDQLGWDWFSLSLEDGSRVMAFQLRQTDGRSYTSGTWITEDGSPTPLPDGAIAFTPLALSDVAGREIPTAWRVSIPSKGLEVDTTPLNTQSWMDTLFPYWEGPIRFSGTHQGRGYLEMTGYE
ncbi:putative secreted hydrolase [Rubricella aquisinus]|uniref:Putative secreted hydrolase n=1 Tax=Rubricella aquisinus TaxID=2028108 RepID=A0A840WZI9_9RHOB|nr:lipocalin-like domain-containing protein [Rubricella aquisinus]MBB5515085.1 putative secreted hydrolase [Rubricella aquisinus]